MSRRIPAGAGLRLVHRRLTIRELFARIWEAHWGVLFGADFQVRVSPKISIRIRGSHRRLALSPPLDSGPKASCAIAVLGSSQPTPLAEMPRPSRRRWQARDCFGLHASRQIGNASPIPLGGFRRVLWTAALPELDRAALSTKSVGASGRPPTP